jgi:peptidoglycan/LPS O-acetylase OafA/YrhL
LFKKLLQLEPDYQKRVFGLDLMRSLAILFVVLRHANLLEKANTSFPWIELIDGVELFFVLSGFLIGSILMKIMLKTEKFDFKTIYKFWIRRWFRTLPNYYLILILNVAFVYFAFIPGDLSQFNWKFFLFLQNFSSGFYGFFWESWSLSIEEWFYLLFPIVLSLLLILRKRLNIQKQQVFLVAIIIFLLTPISLRFFIASKYVVDQFWLVTDIFKVVIYRLDGIALGLLAAYIKHYFSPFWYKSRNISFVLGLALSYFALYYPWTPNAFVTKVFVISIVSFGCFLLLPKFDSMRRAPKPITKIFTHISLISYSMYLINLSLMLEVIKHNFPPQSAISAWLTYFIYWIALIIFSTILYKYFEKPCTDIREKWAKS